MKCSNKRAKQKLWALGLVQLALINLETGCPLIEEKDDILTENNIKIEKSYLRPHKTQVANL